VLRSRIFLLGAALVAFGASLGSGFHFDDYAIFSNPALTSPEGVLDIWGLRGTRPLTYFTFWLNYLVGGRHAFGYHLVNLALHLGAVLLAYECLRRLVPERAAAIGAALFAVHPIQAEAVNYVWARGILLAALLCLASLLAWLDGRRWEAVGWFALALLAKEECAAFPLFLWLLPTKEKGRPQIFTMIGVSLAAGARVIYATGVTPGAPAGFQAGITPWHYLLAQGPVIWRYLRLLVVPFGFTIDPEIHVPSVWLGLFSWALLIGGLLVVWRARRPWSMWVVAAFVLLIPSSSVFPAADLAADRRMYLPMFAIGAAAGLALATLKARPLAEAILCVLLIFSVGRTVTWMNDASLWREAVLRAPNKVRPKIQLARSLPAAEALQLLSKARDEAPNDPAIPAETGRILLAEGQADAALPEFGRALALDPRNALYLNNRGVALEALGQTEAARADFERALEIDPGLAEAKQNLSKLPAR
jgi:tetratricopeptide (TPR) repeat protein